MTGGRPHEAGPGGVDALELSIAATFGTVNRTGEPDR